MAEKIMLIDGNSIVNRAFYGVPLLTNGEGRYTNGVYGFLNILFKLLDEEQPDYLAVAFDLHAPTFRHRTFDGYKGTRKGMPEELREQMPLLKEVLQAMHIPIFEQEGFEADDILGTLGGEKRHCACCGFGGQRPFAAGRGNPQGADSQNEGRTHGNRGLLRGGCAGEIWRDTCRIY